MLKQREETFNESLVSSGTTLTEYPTIFCPIKLHSYPAPCQRPRIQQKPKVHCGGGRQLPFYQDKGKQLSHLTRSTSSIRQNSKRSRYVISTQPCTMLGYRLFLWRPLSSPFAVIRPTDWFWSLHHGVATPQIDSPPCRGESNCNWSRIDRLRSLHIVIPLSSFDLRFFSRTRSILSYIFNRPSPFLDHLSRFSLAPFILGKLSYAASTLVLVNDSRNGWYDDIFTSSLQWTWVVYRIYFSLKHVCSWYWLYVDFYVTKTCSIIWLI